MELAKGSFAVLYWHSLFLENVPRERLGNFVIAAVHAERVAIQVFELFLVAEQSLLQRDVHIHVQIVLDALKHVVWLLLEINDNVALEHIGDLLSLPLKHDLLIMCCAAHHIYC